jgi:heme A synthase
MTRGAWIALIVTVLFVIGVIIFGLIAPDSVKNWPSG